MHCEMLLEEYHIMKPVFEELQQVVMDKLKGLIKQSDFELNSIESRIKSEESLIGKLQRKGHKYSSLTDITDIFGARIITFYNEDVDRIASMAEKLFDIDWEDSVDKRKMHDFDSFGYNSLHYICRMPKSLYFNPQHPEINEIQFEIQMRTALQHVWSAIQHDIGYKTEIETPMEYHRNLSRLAGLLELADNEFSRIRTGIANYRRRAHSLVESGKLEEVQLDGDTFRSYLELHPFEKLNQKIASITQAELHETNLMPFLPVLRQLGMKSLADVEQLKNKNFEDAYQLALFQLGSTDIDILANSIGLQNICIVHTLKSGGGKPGLVQLFDMVNGHSNHNKVLAEIVYKQTCKLAFMHQDNL